MLSGDRVVIGIILGIHNSSPPIHLANIWFWLQVYTVHVSAWHFRKNTWQGFAAGWPQTQRERRRNNAVCRGSPLINTMIKFVGLDTPVYIHTTLSAPPPPIHPALSHTNATAMLSIVIHNHLKRLLCRPPVNANKLD